MNRNVMKYYHPEAHSFDTVPTNGEVGNQSPVDSVALDLSHPSTVSSTNSPRSNRTLRPKRTEQRSDHGGVFENPVEMTQDTPPSPPAVGRGRSWEDQPLTIGRGRGRAATQGEIISIPNNIRDKSLAETRLKRARYDTDEPPDITEEIKVEDEYTTSAKRGKISCDQCYNRKTKVDRSMESSKLLVSQEGRRQVSERTVSVRLLRPDSNHMQYPLGEWEEAGIVDCQHGKRLQAL
jgi:hypothetical protein